MLIVQCLDHEEGSGARWFDLKGEFYTLNEARMRVKHLRATDDERCLYSYRIVEKGSSLYYSQPTDILEY